jgi:hypothetical protein
LLRLSIAASSLGDPAKPYCCRIVTTNFDLLFEDAWAATFGAPALSFDARIAPRPGSRQFEGVVHLHGMLRTGSQEDEQCELIPSCDPMSSAATASDRLRTTQHIDISPNLIKPMSKKGRRWVFRASFKSMIFIWAP